MRLFIFPEIWKRHAVLLGIHYWSFNTKTSKYLPVNLRIDSYSYCWKVNSLSTSWCLGCSQAIVSLCFHSSSHMVSDSTRGTISSAQRRYCRLGWRRWLLENLTSGNSTAPCHSSRRTQSWPWENFCDITPDIWSRNTLLIVMCGTRPNKRSTKLHTITKIYKRLG